jgi:hypothetical protein
MDYDCDEEGRLLVRLAVQMAYYDSHAAHALNQFVGGK